MFISRNVFINKVIFYACKLGFIGDSVKKEFFGYFSMAVPYTSNQFANRIQFLCQSLPLKPLDDAMQPMQHEQESCFGFLHEILHNHQPALPLPGTK